MARFDTKLRNRRVLLAISNSCKLYDNKTLIWRDWYKTTKSPSLEREISTRISTRKCIVLKYINGAYEIQTFRCDSCSRSMNSIMWCLSPNHLTESRSVLINSIPLYSACTWFIYYRLVVTAQVSRFTLWKRLVFKFFISVW